MSTVGTINSYAQRIASVLGETMRTTATATALPTLSYLGSTNTTNSGPFKYVIYALIFAFLILLILTIVHYTVRPIFNFGGNPNALIHLSSSTDWRQDWNDTDTVYNDTVAKETLPQSRYSIVFDTKVMNTIPSNSTKNKFIILYKTTAGQAGQMSSNGESGGEGGGTPTEVVCAQGQGQGQGQGTTSGITGTTTTVLSIRPITNFSFLQNSSVPTGGDPSLFVVYDALASNLQVLIVVTDTTTNEKNYKSATVEITPNTGYRVGIVVGETILELYINGKFATSIAYPGKAINGGATDVLFSAPMIYNQNVSVRNLFTLNRIATSGEIRELGTSTNI